MKWRAVKLVRDGVSKFNADVREYEYRADISHEEHVVALRKKLAEEVAEYLLEPSMDELADVQQVVNDLAYVDMGYTPALVRDKAAAKFMERGGFQRGTMMYVATDPGVSEHG